MPIYDYIYKYIISKSIDEKDKYSSLSDIFDEYVNAVQEDAFYFG